jgi:hypothetical protein
VKKHVPTIIINSPDDIGVHEHDLHIPAALRESLGTHRFSRPKLIPHNFLDLAVTLHDRVIVTTRIVSGESAIRTARFSKDPWAHDKPSVRIPTFAGWKDFAFIPNNACLGTVSEIHIAVRGADMAPERPTNIWFYLTKIRPICLHCEYKYYRLGDVLTEKMFLSYKGESVNMHRKTFSALGVPRYILNRIPPPPPNGRDAHLLKSYQGKSRLAIAPPEDCLSRLRDVFR